MGAMIQNGKVAHMPDDTPPVPATLEEYFTMVGAGLGGSTPHMNSACITALTRILYHFRESLLPETIAGLVETMDLFLTSNNREIVRSVLGFVKVCIICPPKWYCHVYQPSSPISWYGATSTKPTSKPKSSTSSSV